MTEKDYDITEPASPEAAEDGTTMPLGFEQQDSDLTPEQIRRIRFNMYFWHTIGFFLSPFAFALRLGRWSMRTLVCHHNGHEFGDF
jgi:hypothetical protein